MSQPAGFPSAAAEWIWLDGYDDTEGCGQFVLLRKTFTLSAIPRQPILLHVSADTRYRLFLNSQSISFGPSKSYPGRWIYESVDVRPFLRKGTNVLAARVLRFSSSHHGCLSMARTPFPGLILSCEIDDQTILSDASWKAKKDDSVQLVDSSDWDLRLGLQFLCLNERVDARLSNRNWLDASFDDSHWPMAVLQTGNPKNMPTLSPRRLFAREIPALTEEFSRFDKVVQSSDSSLNQQWAELLNGKTTSLTLTPSSTHFVEFSAEKLMTGFIDLKCQFEGSDDSAPSLELLYSECYEPVPEPGKRRIKGDRTDHKTGSLMGTKDFYTPHQGQNHYSPFWWRTFRYIRLTIVTKSDPLVLSDLTYRSTYYPLEVGTTVKTPSTLFTSLWDISLHTLRSCMHETFEDCPYYEQNQFVMDSRSQMLFAYNVSRDDRLARKTMQEFFASRRDDGLVDTYFPNKDRPISIPTFSLFWVLMIYDHMVYFGDEKLVKKYIGAVDGVLGYFDDRVNELGLVGRFDSDCWPFIDWAEGWFTPGLGIKGVGSPKVYHRCGAATYHSLVYAHTLLKAAELCRFLGRYDTAKEYEDRQRQIIAAVRKHCYDPSTGFFLDGPGATEERSQHVQIFAVLSGCVEGEQAKRLMQRTILNREYHKLAKASFAMGYYMFRAASQAGVYEECWDALIQPWKRMIADNLTTWAEGDSMVRSDCHAWSATPLYEICSEVIGVQVRSKAYVKKVLREDGDLQVRVRPRRDLSDQIEASFVIDETSGDRLYVSWKRGGDLVLGSTKDQVVHLWSSFGWEIKKVGAWVHQPIALH